MKNKGFTMAEMLVVVSIITVLTTISFNSFNNQGRRARDDRRMADLEQIRTALEMSRLASPTRVYPPDLAALVTDRFLPQQLEDPMFAGGQHRYVYIPGATWTTYSLCARMEITTGGSACTAPGADCGSASGTQTCNYQITNP